MVPYIKIRSNYIEKNKKTSVIKITTYKKLILFWQTFPAGASVLRLCLFISMNLNF